MEIIKDIRFKHENDVLSAPKEDIAKKNQTFLQENLEETFNKKNLTSDTLQIAESLGMNCEALTEEERVIFLDLLKKSDSEVCEDDIEEAIIAKTPYYCLKIALIPYF